MDLRKSVIRRHLGKNEKRNPTGALRLLSSISFQDNRKRQEMLRRWRQDMKAHDVKMKWERTKEKGSERKGWKDTYDRATKNVLGLLRLVTYANEYKKRELSDRERTSEMCFTCGKANCICNFVPEKDKLF